jgi:tyrosyl-tRNA synthetase
LGEDKINFVLASEIYDNDYWADVLRISRLSTLKRLIRCTAIMGRKESEANHASHIVYPIMQAADIFKLGADVAHGGMDQRKVHMFAREIAEKLGRKKPIALHTQLLMGLQGPKKMGFEQNEAADTSISSKMSKSDPASCVFIHDSEEDIAKKIGKAYCPEKVAENNPVIQLAEVVLMHQPSFKIERPAKYGGSLEIASAGELKTIYTEGKLHPMDLKNGVVAAVAKILKPSREYFEKNKDALELLKEG